jgi:hypothetical protein
VAIEARVTFPSALTPACGTASTPEVATLQPIPHLSNLGHAGAAGCDVCGQLRHDKLWVVLPPERTWSRELEVRLDDGSRVAFQIQNVAARALSITLPPPPAGRQYRSGRVSIY